MSKKMIFAATQENLVRDLALTALITEATQQRPQLGP